MKETYSSDNLAPSGSMEQDASSASDYRKSHLGKEKAQSYAAVFDDPNRVNHLYWRLEKQILAKLLGKHDTHGSDLLDFACGTGRIIAFLEDHFQTSTGIDISPDMLEIARDACSRSEFVCGDVTHDEIAPNAKFDVATSFRFFLNAQPPLRSEVLAWIHSQLRKEGLLICNFHLNPASLVGIRQRLACWATHRPVPPMMSIGAARRLLREVGFKVVDIVSYGFLPHSRKRLTPIGPSLFAIERALLKLGVLRAFGRNFIVVARKS